MKKGLFFTSLAMSSFLAIGGTMGPLVQPISPYYVSAAGGYGVIDGAYGQDGNTAFGRLAAGMRVFNYQDWQMGGELGVQSGNVMRLAIDQSVINSVGGLYPQAKLNPLVDLLFTVKGSIISSPYNYILKGGIAYRQLSFLDRFGPQDTLNKISGEFQGGLGVNLTPHVMLTAFYQGIYSSNSVNIGTDANLNTTMLHIPTQQAGFLGIEYAFM